jgi:hypothetical protein
MAISAYPLQWPDGWPRTKPYARKGAQFGRGERHYTDTGSYSRKRDLTVSDGVERVLAELARMGVERQDVVVSTNVRTRLDGLPRSGERKPDDPGAAVYWETRKGERRVMAIDRYDEVADNLAAIAATLEAMRAIERHGGAQILDRAFTGFTALPSPGGKRSWRDVLGFSETETGVNEAIVQARYRLRAAAAHPDRPGGSHAAMAELNAARDEALRAIGGQ